MGVKTEFSVYNRKNQTQCKQNIFMQRWYGIGLQIIKPNQINLSFHISKICRYCFYSQKVFINKMILNPYQVERPSNKTVVGFKWPLEKILWIAIFRKYISWKAFFYCMCLFPWPPKSTFNLQSTFKVQKWFIV